MSNLSLGSGFLAGVTSKAHLIHVGALSGRATRARIRRVIRESVEGPVSRLPRTFRLPAFASWIILLPPGLQLSLRSAYQAIAWTPMGFPRFTPGRRGWGGRPLYSGTSGVLLPGKPSRKSLGAFQHRVLRPPPAHHRAVLPSRSISKGSLAFARPAFPSPVTPRWPRCSWA